MTQSAGTILAHREKAAELSRGTSAWEIYSMIESVVEAQDLRGNVLDYGAGVGELTRRLVAMNRFDSVSAADIMREPADLNAEWIQQDLNDPIQAPEGTFDSVIAAEVIEHLENPRFTVRELHRVLRPGGTVLITTPNNESWRSILALLLRGHYVAFGESARRRFCPVPKKGTSVASSRWYLGHLARLARRPRFRLLFVQTRVMNVTTVKPIAAKENQ